MHGYSRGPLVTIDLPDITWNREVDFSWIGADLESVSYARGLGDLNGDGYDEFMFMGISADGGKAIIGGSNIYLVAGEADFFGTHGSEPATDSSLYAAAYEGASLIRLCDGTEDAFDPAVGDLDGDGYGDFGLCVNYASASKVDVAADLQMVHLHYGGETIPQDLLDGPAVINIPAESGVLLYGSRAADINGDGVDDLLMPYSSASEPSKALTERDVGIMVIMGVKDDRSDKSVPEDVSLVIELGSSGEQPDLYVLGDSNADGYDEFVATLYTYNADAGEYHDDFFAFLGKAEWPATMTAEEADVTTEGKDSVSIVLFPVGDVNNDGYDDLSMQMHHELSDSQSQYLFYGSRLVGTSDTMGLTSSFGFRVALMLTNIEGITTAP
jgi:hypothetical protein